MIHCKNLYSNHALCITEPSAIRHVCAHSTVDIIVIITTSTVITVDADICPTIVVPAARSLTLAFSSSSL